MRTWCSNELLLLHAPLLTVCARGWLQHGGCGIGQVGLPCRSAAEVGLNSAVKFLCSRQKVGRGAESTAAGFPFVWGKHQEVLGQLLLCVWGCSESCIAPRAAPLAALLQQQQAHHPLQLEIPFQDICIH